MTTPGLTEADSARLNGLYKVAEKVGLAAMPAVLEAAVKAYDDALAAKREHDAILGEAQAAYDDAAALAEMAEARRVRREGNKTFVPDGDAERQVTADEAKQWVARQVAADPDVSRHARNVASERVAAEEARDRVKVAEVRISAVRHSVDANVAIARLMSAFAPQGGVG